MSDEASPFDDGEALDAEGLSDAELATTLDGMVRADLADTSPGVVLRSFEAAGAEARVRLAFAWNEAMAGGDLAAWIAADAGRRRRAEEMALRMLPPNPSPRENDAALATLAGFDGWDAFEVRLLIVPGYTPPGAVSAQPGVHPVARRRLEQARGDYDAGRAPFLLVSGANVYPRGTPYYEALEMKKALLAMGVPAERVLVDPRARHSTTNLRNAGRFMLDHGIARAVIATLGGGVLGSDVFGQDFYFAHPILSTFYRRCERELGYRVGELEGVGEDRIAFVPSAEVRRINFRDALDP